MASLLQVVVVVPGGGVDFQQGDQGLAAVARWCAASRRACFSGGSNGRAMHRLLIRASLGRASAVVPVDLQRPLVEIGLERVQQAQLVEALVLGRRGLRSASKAAKSALTCR